MRIHPKKSLGQNFLIDNNIRNKIISSLSLKPSDVVLEIGSGKGEITGIIGSRVKKVYALEIDPRLVNDLIARFKDTPNICVMKQDILKLDLKKLLATDNIKSKIKIFGNIPYYISSPIIEYLLNYRNKIEDIYISVQKEFAQRVAASAGNKEYGSFSCFTQYYTSPEIIFDISRNSFKPVPKVNSSFLRLKVREEPKVSVKDEEAYFKILRGAFNQRRKTLRNSLKDILPEEQLAAFFKATGIDKNIRPEDLTLEDFAVLANY